VLELTLSLVKFNFTCLLFHLTFVQGHGQAWVLFCAIFTFCKVELFLDISAGRLVRTPAIFAVGLLLLGFFVRPQAREWSVRIEKSNVIWVFHVLAHY
jgi:hypothetical protein